MKHICRKPTFILILNYHRFSHILCDFVDEFDVYVFFKWLTLVICSITCRIFHCYRRNMHTYAHNFITKSITTKAKSSLALQVFQHFLLWFLLINFWQDTHFQNYYILNSLVSVIFYPELTNLIWLIMIVAWAKNSDRCLHCSQDLSFLLLQLLS